MVDSARDNRLVWGLVVLAVALALALLWVWNIGTALSGVEARFAGVPAAGAIAEIEQRQAAIETRLAEIPDLAPLQGDVAALKESVAGLDQRVTDGPWPGLDALVQRVDAVEAAVAGIPPADFSRIDTALTALRADIDGLRAQVGDLAPARLAALDGTVDGLAGTVETLSGTVATLGTRVDSLGVEVAAGETALQSRLDELATRLAGVPDVAPLETRLGLLSGDVETLKTDIAAVPTGDDIGALVRTETAALSAEIGQVGAALTTKAESAEVTALTQRLEALRTEVAALPGVDTAAFTSAVAGLRADLDALHARVEALPPAREIAALRTDLDRLAATPPAPRPPQLLERVYFPSSGTGVPEAELAKLAALAQRLAGQPLMLDLVGFSDSKGPAELNRALSLRRAAAVRLALIRAGVDRAAVTSVVGLGEDAPPVDAGDDTAEPGNRVVLIYGR